MVFSSITFLFYFLPLVLLGYFLLPRKFRNLHLLLFSLVFYAWGEPRYVLLMLASILVNWGLAFGIHEGLRRRELGSHAVPAARDGQEPRSAAPRFARSLAPFMLVAAILFNLSLLGVFKYADFIVGNINASGLLGYDLPLPRLALPIGISFYTFQVMSYIIDLYRGEVEIERNLLNLACYVTMFPQLIAGPIVRFETIAAELRQREESFYDIDRGIERFIQGLAKKALLANMSGELWKEINGYAIGNLGTGLAWLGLIAFAFQIYFDFSAYSDMAIGLGWIFGFHFEENFNYPYMAESITDFWRRWHISLSTWFREYVYIPLGGNRKGAPRLALNLLIVWCLTGIWHGAAWNFLLWGFYFALLLILEKFLLGRFLRRLPRFFRHVYTLFFVLLSWAVFAQDQWPRLLAYMERLFVRQRGGAAGTALLSANGTLATLRDTGGELIYHLLSYGPLLLILALFSTPYPARLWQRCSEIHPYLPKKSLRVHRCLRYSCLLLLWILSVAAIVSANYNPFLYFRF